MATVENLLVSKRIILRSMTLDDVDAKLIEWLNSPIVCRYLEVRGTPVSELSQREFVSEKIKSPSEYYFLVMNSLKLGIGTASLSWDKKNGKATIGLMIGDRDYWGKGLGTEIIEALCAFAFDNLGVRKIVAGVLEPNKASLRAFIKAGFSVEATLRKEALLENLQIVDAYRVSLFSP